MDALFNGMSEERALQIISEEHQEQLEKARELEKEKEFAEWMITTLVGVAEEWTDFYC